MKISKRARSLAASKSIDIRLAVPTGPRGRVIERDIRKMIEESGFENVKVVATGGLGKMIAEEADCIDYYDASLTLKGLQIIYDKQKR